MEPRCSVGLGNGHLYSATRHYFAWYAFNVARLPAHVIALHLGHGDGGTLVAQLYGHADAVLSPDRLRETFAVVEAGLDKNLDRAV